MTAAAMRPTARVTIEIDPITLTHEEAFPDWDGQEMGAADVARAIEADGGIARVIREWNLNPSATVTVITEADNPAYGGDDVLFGDAPPRVLVVRSEAVVS